MKLLGWSALVVVPLVLALAACGGSSDDDDDDDDGGGGNSPFSQGSSSGDGNGSSKSSSGKAPVGPLKIQDGPLNGSLTLEVTGDKKVKYEMEGGGVTQGGIAIIGFSDGDRGIQIVVGGGSADEPGGFAFSSPDFATAGEWGDGCDISIDDSASAMKGEFTCKSLQAVVPGSLKTLKVNLSGKFDLNR